MLIEYQGCYGSVLGDISTLDESCQKKGDCLPLKRQGSLEKSPQLFDKNFNSSSFSTESSTAVPANREVSKLVAENNGHKNDSRTFYETEKRQDEAKNLSTPHDDLPKVFYWSGVIFNGDRPKSPTHTEFNTNVSKILSSLNLIPGNAFQAGVNGERNLPYVYFIFPQENIQHDLNSNEKLNTFNENSSYSYSGSNYPYPFLLKPTPPLPTYSDFRDSQKSRNVPESNYQSIHRGYQQEQRLVGKVTHNNEMIPIVIINHVPNIIPEQNKGRVNFFSGYQPDLAVSREADRIPSTELKVTNETEKSKLPDMKSPRETEKIQLPELKAEREAEELQSPETKELRETEETQSPEQKTSRETEKAQSPEAPIPCKKDQEVPASNKFIFVPIRLDLQSHSGTPERPQAAGGLNRIVHNYPQNYQKQNEYNPSFGQYNSIQFPNNVPHDNGNTQSLPEANSDQENQVTFVEPIILYPPENRNNLPVTYSFFHKYENQNKQYAHQSTGSNVGNGSPKPNFIVHRSGLLQDNFSENATKILNHMDLPKDHFLSAINNKDPANHSHKTKRSVTNPVFPKLYEADKVDIFRTYLNQQNENFPMVSPKVNETSDTLESSNVEYALLNTSEVTYFRNEGTEGNNSRTKNVTDISPTSSEPKNEELVYSQAFNADVSPCNNDPACYRSHENFSSDKSVANVEIPKQMLYEYATNDNGDHSGLFRAHQDYSSESPAMKRNQKTLLHENTIPLDYRYFYVDSAALRKNTSSTNLSNLLRILSFTENSNYRNIPLVSAVKEYSVDPLSYAVHSTDVNEESHTQTEPSVKLPSARTQVIKSPAYSYIYYNRHYPSSTILKDVNVRNYPKSPTYLKTPKDSRNVNIQTQPNAFYSDSNLANSASQRHEHVPGVLKSYRQNFPMDNITPNNVPEEKTHYYIKEDPVFRSEKEVPFTLSLVGESSEKFGHILSRSTVYSAPQHQGVILQGNSRRNPSFYTYSTPHSEPQAFAIRISGRSASEVAVPLAPLASHGLNVVKTVLPTIPPLQNLKGRLVTGMELSKGFGSNSGYRISYYRQPQEPHGYTWKRL